MTIDAGKEPSPPHRQKDFKGRVSRRRYWEAIAEASTTSFFGSDSTACLFLLESLAEYRHAAVQVFYFDADREMIHCDEIRIEEFHDLIIIAEGIRVKANELGAAAVLSACFQPIDEPSPSYFDLLFSACLGYHLRGPDVEMIDHIAMTIDSVFSFKQRQLICAWP